MLAWASMMQAGLGKLKLAPHQFWALTPHELLVLLSMNGQGSAMTRDRLATLMAAFPDTKRK